MSASLPEVLALATAERKKKPLTNCFSNTYIHLIWISDTDSWKWSLFVGQFLQMSTFELAKSGKTVSWRMVAVYLFKMVPQKAASVCWCALFVLCFNPGFCHKTRSSFCHQRSGWVHRGCDIIHQLLQGQLYPITHQGMLQQWQTLVHSHTQKVMVGKGKNVQE